MKSSTHAQPNALNNQPAQDEIEYRQCRDCYAKRLIQDFGVARWTPGGKSHICKDCRAQYLRLTRAIKYNREPRERDLHIRSVYGQNCGLIQYASTHPGTTLIGFIPHTDKVFRVHFGRSRYDMESMAVFSNDGSTYLEIAYSGLHPVMIMKNLTDALKAHGIRLEADEAAMIQSKTVLYYL